MNVGLDTLEGHKKNLTCLKKTARTAKYIQDYESLVFLGSRWWKQIFSETSRRRPWKPHVFLRRPKDSCSETVIEKIGFWVLQLAYTLWHPHYQQWVVKRDSQQAHDRGTLHCCTVKTLRRQSESRTWFPPPDKSAVKRWKTKYSLSFQRLPGNAGE